MTFKEYIRLAHSDGNVPSSKRFWGAAMIACSQICIIAASILSFIAGSGITTTLKDLIEVDIVVGATLLGLQTVSTMFNQNKNATTDEKS